MNKVELKEGTSVFTLDGHEMGKINRLVLNPETDEITHIVVQKGWLFPEDKVIPFNWVISVNEDKVVLEENAGDFDHLPPFEVTHYIGVSDRDAAARTAPADSYPGNVFAPAYYWYPPFGYASYPATMMPYYSWPPIETEQNIPANTVPLKEGAQVVIAEGTLFKDRKLIPVNWVKSVSEEEVRLNVTTDILNRVPAYQS